MIKRVSHKDLLLLLGILVAAIIALTTVVYRDSPSEATRVLPSPKKTSSITKPVTIVKQFIEKVVFIAASHNSPSSR
jgi:hypothetical protein